MNIKLTLYKSLIFETIKAETYIKGTVDKATDDKATALAFQETAGDETVHERKLQRCLSTSIATLKTQIAPFLDQSETTQGTNVSTEIDDDKIYFYLSVSDRFNRSMIDPLAKLFSKFIEENSLMLWYGAFDQKQAQFYQGLLVEDMTEIRQAFSKKAPVNVAIPYTEHLTIANNSITMMEGEEESVTYTIDEGALDDIEIVPDNNCISTRRTMDGFLIKANRPGFAHCTLFSVHDETICQPLDIVVTQHT